MDEENKQYWYRRYTQHQLDNRDRFVFQVNGTTVNDRQNAGFLDKLRYKMRAAAIAAILTVMLWFVRRQLRKSGNDVFQQSMLRKR